MELTDIGNDKKTTYTIIDEHKERSTITIDKWAADLLQDMLPDVHLWIQEKYNLILQKKPELSRRERGNILREVARIQAQKSKDYVSILNFL